MIRFLHTADWQLGLKLRYVPGDRGADLRAVRFEVVRRLAELAHERGVAAVVVAGDVFDDNTVGPRTLQKARESLDVFAPIPVLLLPGNHDAAAPGGALARLEAGGHVHLLVEERPLDIHGARFYPCPLHGRHEYDDPTANLPERSPGDPIRVAIAHGAVLDFDENCETPNYIDARRVIERGFDYLALGDWHGTFSFEPRVWYPGTPEQTRFKEQDAGNALIVEIDEPGAASRVEKVRVGRTHWIRHQETIGKDEDVESLARWLRELPPIPSRAERSMTLLELVLEGVISLEARTLLETVLGQTQDELLYTRVNTRGLINTPTEADIEDLRVEGFVGDAVSQLAGQEDTAASDALSLLHRIAIESRGEDT